MRKLLLFSACFTLLASGCHVFEYLAPHQLWKLNRQPAMGGEDGMFSIPADPFAAAPAESAASAP